MKNLHIFVQCYDGWGDKTYFKIRAHVCVCVRAKFNNMRQWNAIGCLLLASEVLCDLFWLTAPPSVWSHLNSRPLPAHSWPIRASLPWLVGGILLACQSNSFTWRFHSSTTLHEYNTSQRWPHFGRERLFLGLFIFKSVSSFSPGARPICKLMFIFSEMFVWPLLLFKSEAFEQQRLLPLMCNTFHCSDWLCSCKCRWRPLEIENERFICGLFQRYQASSLLLSLQNSYP